MRRTALTDAECWDGVWRSAGPARTLRPWHPYFGRRGLFMRMIGDCLGDVAGKRILEVGAGGNNHRLLTLCKWGGAEVTAVDYSSVGLDALRALFEHNGCRVETQLGDFLELPAPTPGYDVVVHWGVLEHFSDPRPLLQACRRALAPQGVMLFTMPNMEAWAARGWARFSPENWSRHLLHSDDELAQACRAAKLEMRRCFYFGHLAVQFTAAERGGVVPTLLTWGQPLATLPGALVRLPGSRRTSAERGVLAVPG